MRFKYGSPRITHSRLSRGLGLLAQEYHKNHWVRPRSVFKHRVFLSICARTAADAGCLFGEDH